MPYDAGKEALAAAAPARYDMPHERQPVGRGIGMAPRVDKVTPSQWTGEGADVVVVGGGIIGCSTALFLARRGISVALLEKSEIGCEQSSRNWGWCRAQGRDVREIPLILESLRLWRSLDNEIGAVSGFATCGTLNVLSTDRQIEDANRWLDKAKSYDVDCRMISSAEIAALVPDHRGNWKEALHCPSDGRAEPGLAAPAIAAAAKRAGARIHTGRAVVGIELSGGAISGVAVEGGRISCSQVVIAGGAWSSALLRPLGIGLPQLPVIESVLRTTPVAGGPSVSIKGGGFSTRRRMDGGYTIGYGATMTGEIVADSFRFLSDFLPLMKDEWRTIRLHAGRRTFASMAGGGTAATPRAGLTLDPAPLKRDITKAWRNLRQALPQFRDARVAEEWAGLIDVTPDVVPVISRVESVPGLTVSTGYSGHGFGIGLGAGRLTADLVANDNPVVDAAPFRLSRFRTGRS
ncbi:FAD-binding oxidoreductase [Mesorhizobium sp. SP-1A]|uniref:NAD(P)/FAD-dependent oxidoreductase n=1 Tax=Mesorhizobium sp. SP-1A TaxID=3077840 RepID=UPI0028F6F4B6|nr:FAD-binding oxidoreductase [Mesorhizobium sp. SP-1A]